MAIHSADWRRQSLQPLFELAAALLPARNRVVVVGDGDQVEPQRRVNLLLGTVALPATCITSLGPVYAEMRRFQSLVGGPFRSPRLTLDRTAILAICRGDAATASGGSVTHAAGMLGAFRRLGFDVGLVTMSDPPPQLRAVIDDLEVARPLPRRARVTKEVEQISLNRLLLLAGGRLLERMKPAFIYQRYDAFMTCGIELAQHRQIPLVLEWNGSAAWDRQYWGPKQSRVKHLFDRFLLAVEREALVRCALVRAVSDRAAEMAVECGAHAERVVSIANAVDLTPIAAPGPSLRRNRPAVVGWVGSFGPWHGAPVLIQALPQLPGVQALLIGEGAERAQCMALARRLGVEHRIQWAGALAHDEVIARLRTCDVLVSPHVPSEGRPFFGSPTKLFEFMAIGRPIVASELEQLGDVLEHGRTAHLVRPGDIDDLARGIRAVLDRPDRGYALGLAARADVEEHHTWDDRADTLLRRLESIGQDGSPIASVRVH